MRWFDIVHTCTVPVLFAAHARGAALGVSTLMCWSSCSGMSDGKGSIVGGLRHTGRATSTLHAAALARARASSGMVQTVSGRFTHAYVSRGWAVKTSVCDVAAHTARRLNKYGATILPSMRRRNRDAGYCAMSS